MNEIKQIGLAALALLGFATTGNGATVTTFDPTIGTTTLGGTVSIENSDEGAIYDSASHDFFSGLYDAGLNPSISIRQPPTGDLMSGWTANRSSDNVDLTHAPFGYQVWDNETLANSFTVNLSDLESNGIPGYQPFSLADLQSGSFDPSQFDHSIFLTSNDIFNLNGSNQVIGTSIVYSGTHTFNELGTFTASDQGGFNTWQGQAPKYVVESPNSYAVPEPSTYATIVSLLALGAAGMKRPRRRE